MIDKEIEQLYRKLITIDIIKRMKTKNMLIQVILPLLIMVLSLIFSFIFIDRLVYVIFFSISILMTFLIDTAIKKQMIEDYGETDSKDYYKCFEQEINKHKIEYNDIKKAKALFELENNYIDYKFKRIFSSILALIIIPTLFIHFNDKIANDFFFMFRIVFITILIPIILNPLSVIINYKYYRRLSIIKKLERYIILNVD